MDDKFQKITDLVANVMEAYTAALFIADPLGENLALFRHSSLSKKIYSHCLLKSGDGLIGWVFLEQKKLLASNFERDTTTLKIYKKDEKIKSLMALPLASRKGVLFVDSKKSYSFSEEKEKIFMQLADIASTLIKDQEMIVESFFMGKALTAFSRIEEYLRFNTEPDLSRVAAMFEDGFKLSHLFIVIPGLLVFSHINGSGAQKSISTTHAFEFYSADGLLGWCLKNRKKIIKKRISANKQFLLKSDEEFGDINNFLGIPIINFGKKSGVLGVVRDKPMEDGLPFQEDMWSSKEIDIMEKIGKMLLHNMT